MRTNKINYHCQPEKKWIWHTHRLTSSHAQRTQHDEHSGTIFKFLQG